MLIKIIFINVQYIFICQGFLPDESNSVSKIIKDFLNENVERIKIILVNLTTDKDKTIAKE